MGAVVSAVKSAVESTGGIFTGSGGGGGGGGGGLFGFVSDAFSDVGNFVNDNIIQPTAKAVEKTVNAALKDPIGTAAMVVTAVYAPELLPAVSATNAVAHGASLEDAAKAAAISYGAGQLTQGVNTAATGATGSALAGNTAQGAASAVVQGKDPLAGAVNSAFNYGINAGAKSGLTALNTPTPNSDNLNTPSLDKIGSTSPADYSFSSGTDSGLKIPSSIANSGSTDITSPIDSVVGDSNIKVDPNQLGSSDPTSGLNIGSSVDTFPTNYSLLSNATTKNGVDPLTGTGLQMNPWTGGATDVGNTPVDYSLTNPNETSGGLGLQMPDSPAIKAMGGAQGLTTSITNPDGSTGVMGGLGYTPTGAAPVLGDPSSFINNPNVTGQPIMATDPAYYDVSVPHITTKGLIDTSSPLNQSPTAKTPKEAAAPKSTYSTPLDAAASLDSYLNTTGATDAAAMAKLKQLFPNLTPDMAKILMERAGITPSMLMSSDTPAADVQSAGSPDLSAMALANIGQPDEFAQYAAKGGSMKSSKGHRPEFITGKTGHYAQGRGTGQSDDIPATLHDGDYVVDADTVAALGDGSSKAGAGALEQFRRGLPEHFSGGGQPIPAQIADGEYVLPAGFVTTLGHGSNKQGAKMLDAMREQIRAHKRSAPDTKIPPKARSPLQYMNEAMKG